jgi:hypothetical protein
MSLLLAKIVFVGLVTAYKLLVIIKSLGEIVAVKKREGNGINAYLSFSWNTNKSLSIFSESNG